MNWRFWRRDAAADSTRREIEQLRTLQRHMREQMAALQQENREAWEILAAITERIEKPEDVSAFVGWLRCITMKHGDKLRRINEAMRKERSR